MKTELFHTENAGVYLRTEQTALLIDGVHGGDAVGFSPMPREEEEEIAAREGIFSRLDALLFTHLHIDHFRAKNVTALLQQYPDLAIWGPGLEKRHLENYREEGEDVRFTIGDISVHAYRTDHSGKPYQKEPHDSLVVRNEACEEVFLISGDAVFYPEMAARIREETPEITAAFVMIYQLIEPSSVAFLKELAPQRVFLYHNPTPEEDRNGLLPLTRQRLRHDPLKGKTIEVLEHRSWIR